MRRAHEEGVAVGRGLGRGRCADSAAGAGAVFDQHALAQLGVELGRQRAGKGIGAAAGRERHDEGDRLVGPCLGLGDVWAWPATTETTAIMQTGRTG